METIKNHSQKIILIVFKDLAVTHTATSLAKELHMSRWGVWKILKKLEAEELIILKPTGKGKTSTQQVVLQWDNPLVEKTLSLSLTQEALLQKRWINVFIDLKKDINFLILYGSIIHSPKEANDIDIIEITNEKNMNKIGDIIMKIQQTQSKKIHAINFTQKELRQELKKPNKAFIDAIKKGIVLFGQENFIKFIKDLK